MSISTTGVARVTALVVGPLLVLGGCGGSGNATKKESDEKSLDQAADRTTCVADAKAISSFPAGFPKDFYIPDRTVLFDAQDRGKDGVVVTGITPLEFKLVLDELNGPAQKEGWKVTSGETEEHDAEANWTGHGYRGRWAIRESSTCNGETVFQVLAKKQ